MSSFDKGTLKRCLRPIIENVVAAEIEHTDEKLTKNTLDCFGALIDSATQKITIKEWKRQEKARQIQKTKQNLIGKMHETIIGTIHGVELLNQGICDLKCERLKIVAEIKNKWNTTKGNHKNQIYRDLKKVIEKNYGFTGYYVEILPKHGKSYNEPFTPSDNRLSIREEKRSDIRRIDGRSFYALLTGNKTALDELYQMLPNVISELLNEIDNTTYNKLEVQENLKEYNEYLNLYNIAYNTNLK